MTTQMITIASIQRPQVGKKMWAAIDVNNQRWGVWPDKVSALQEGGTYEISFKSNDFQGKTYYTIETAVPVGNGRAPGLILPKPSTVISPPRQDSHYEDQRRQDIFVSVLINNCSLDPALAGEQDIVDMVNKFRRIWKRVFGPQAQETVERGARDDELNDKIPF